LRCAASLLDSSVLPITSRPGYLATTSRFRSAFSSSAAEGEDLLRTHAQLFGHRYLMGRDRTGGVAKEPDRASRGESLTAHIERIEREVATLNRIYDEHAGAQDRFILTGQVTPPPLAERMGSRGLPAERAGIGAISRSLRNPGPISTRSRAARTPAATCGAPSRCAR